MANICYSAVIVSRKDFPKVMKYLETKDFEKCLEKMYIDCENNGDSPRWTDYMGFAYWSKKYIFRFESAWCPPEMLAREISKKCIDPIEFWYQETGVGFAGMDVWAGEDNCIDGKIIKCDITDPDMRKCLYYTDWDGINWTQCIEGTASAIRIEATPRYPDYLKAYVETAVEVENGEDYMYKWVQTETCNCLPDKLGAFIEAMEKKYAKKED